jgi:uncharacterized repeat protein (TIGR02543 family)
VPVSHSTDILTTRRCVTEKRRNDFNQAGPGTQSITTASQRPFLNQLVWLAATPSPGWTFQGWSGDCRGTNPTVQVTVDADFACTATFTFVPSGGGGGGGADLVVASLSFDRLTATSRVRNQGSSAAPPTMLWLACSLHPTGGSVVAQAAVPGLAPGQEATIRTSYSCRQNYLVATVDPTNNVAETNESNNTRAVRLR